MWESQSWGKGEKDIIIRIKRSQLMMNLFVWRLERDQSETRSSVQGIRRNAESFFLERIRCGTSPRS